MKYSQLVHKIKAIAGAGEDESEDALEVLVETVAVNLDTYSRKGFASRLPTELRSAAQMELTASHLDEDIVDQLMDLNEMDEITARKILRAAWRALIELFDSESAEDIQAGLPPHVKSVLLVS